MARFLSRIGRRPTKTTLVAAALIILGMALLRCRTEDEKQKELPK